jgi:hypothetical protein
MTKRRMMFVPEVNSTSFVFFFEKGNSGTSWSIRDYSTMNRSPIKYGPRNFRGWNADDIRLKARYSFDAPTVHTDNIAFWHKKTEELNTRYLVKPVVAPSTISVHPSTPANSTRRPEPTSPSKGFPGLNLGRLLGMLARVSAWIKSFTLPTAKIIRKQIPVPSRMDWSAGSSPEERLTGN